MKCVFLVFWLGLMQTNRIDSHSIATWGRC